MLKKLFVLVFMFASISPAWAKQAKNVDSAPVSAPKDFRFILLDKAGSMGEATSEKITIEGGTAKLQRDAKIVGESGDKKPFSTTYTVSPAQLDGLYQIIQQSGFMTWADSAEASHQSQVQESMEVTADGKTVKRSRWQGGNQDRYRILYEEFNRWYTDIRSARF